MRINTPIATGAATKRKSEKDCGSFPQSGCYGLLTALRKPHVENSRIKSVSPEALNI